MVFNQIYRIFSILFSSFFIGVFFYAWSVMLRRPDYIKISLFEILLAFAFLFGAVLIMTLTISTWNYNKKITSDTDIIDLQYKKIHEIKLRSSWFVYAIGTFNVLIALTLVIGFGIIFTDLFLSGGTISHIRIVPFALNLSLICFGILQLIYSIRMIHFHRKLKQ